eukprot:1234760-Rhodomonas_salina.1
MSPASSASPSICERAAASEGQLVRSLWPDSPSRPMMRPRTRRSTSLFSNATSCSSPSLVPSTSKQQTLPNLFPPASRRHSEPPMSHPAADEAFTAALLEIVELRRRCLEHTTHKSLMIRRQSFVKDRGSPKPADAATFN